MFVQAQVSRYKACHRLALRRAYAKTNSRPPVRRSVGSLGQVDRQQRCTELLRSELMIERSMR